MYRLSSQACEFYDLSDQQMKESGIYSTPVNSDNKLKHPYSKKVNMTKELEYEEGSRYFCESLFWASQPKQAAKT
ncbi:hypothetical protein [Bathymodiolus platifrons methanotrophic gill symbiont]|uniref:hypothetical protein n=1 Tax=Bathymodiolus platifrons methanotrophic gill symbiont TaxID=113268 RepID=UPI001C8E8FEC|nr:hypothetical protein [Bathymodiolus platifrons methanotrophic gill symbiont]